MRVRLLASRMGIRFLYGLGLVSLLIGACNCDEEPLSPAQPGMCERTYECPAGFEYRQGECRAARCQKDLDCCPGQKCNKGAGFCADQFVACSDDAECTEVPGQTCIDFRGSKFCGYPNRGRALSELGTQLCLTQADCDPGRTCFGGRCVTHAPCGGGCPSGQLCDVDSNTCFESPSCEETCGEGQMLVVADPDRSSGASCCKVDCKCETLPPVLPGQVGWHASLDLTENGVSVAAFDPVYGDLVVQRFDRSGTPLRLEYVDGFPTSGPIVANPAGPRGGRDEPGPVVGEYTSVAVDARGVTHVAYYDRTQGQLKYANDASGIWNTEVVDASGRVGLFTSIALDANGHPAIAYMMVEGLVSPDPLKRTGLKYAAARTASPASSNDWAIQVIDSRTVVEPPCGAGCPSDQACVDTGSGAACRVRLSNCTESCTGEQACVQVSGAPACVAKVPSLPVDDLIPGTGLFASLAFGPDGLPVIAYYDRVSGDLRLAKGNGAGAFEVRTLDGNDAMRPTDVGQSASLAISPTGVIGIAYVDATHDDLVYLQLGTEPIREIVDNGVMPPDLRMVGHDASLIFDEAGRPAIAYQDPTHIDLLYARRLGAPAMWSTEVMRGAPPPGRSEGKASGFYAAQKRSGSKAFVSNVDVGFDTSGELRLTLSVIVRDL